MVNLTRVGDGAVGGGFYWGRWFLLGAVVSIGGGGLVPIGGAIKWIKRSNDWWFVGDQKKQRLVVCGGGGGAAAHFQGSKRAMIGVRGVGKTELLVQTKEARRVVGDGSRGARWHHGPKPFSVNFFFNNVS
jgi:hypothetical protein